MRQVPFVTSYLVIGSGRMATHFCHYLSLLKIPYQQWARKTHRENTLKDAISQATHILLLIKDTAISTFAKKWQTPNDHKTWVHFSGQLHLPNVQGAHPLMTFTHQLYDLATYQSVPFILTEDAPILAELLPHLPNQAQVIPAALKTYYHAMCVISGNFTCLVWQKMFQSFTDTLNIPPKTAEPYFKQIMKNILSSPNNCLTGPLVRGDKGTIGAHLNALQDDDFLPIYQAVLQYVKHEETV